MLIVTGLRATTMVRKLGSKPGIVCALAHPGLRSATSAKESAGGATHSRVSLRFNRLSLHRAALSTLYASARTCRYRPILKASLRRKSWPSTTLSIKGDAMPSGFGQTP
jgi:hypothetical protein